MAYDPAFPPASGFISDTQMQEQFAQIGDHLMQHLIASGWTGKDGLVVFVRPGSPPAIDAPADTDELSFNGATLSNFVLKAGDGLIPPVYGVSGGVVAMSAADARYFDVALNDSVDDDGFSLSDLPAGLFACGTIRVAQDATGSRLIGGGTSVNDGFDSTDFDFGGETIPMPQAANAYVILGWLWYGAGKVCLLRLFTSS